MERYDELNFIDKIIFKIKVRQQQKTKGKEKVDTQTIINELLARKKNNIKRLPSPSSETNKKMHTNLDQYKVPNDAIKSPLELYIESEQQQLDQLLGKELNSKEEAYDNIVELQTFLSYPHDYLPYAENKINEKLYYIQTILGKDILDKGLEIFKFDQSAKQFYTTLPLENRTKIQQEIINNPKLAEQLAFLRYHPEKSKNINGKLADYLSVYCYMIENYKSENKDSQEISL